MIKIKLYDISDRGYQGDYELPPNVVTIEQLFKHLHSGENPNHYRVRVNSSRTDLVGTAAPNKDGQVAPSYELRTGDTVSISPAAVKGAI